MVLPYINMNLPRYTCVPHPEPSSLLPPHTIPLGPSSAPAPSIQYRASNLDWRLISYMILYMFQCHSPKSSHPLPRRWYMLQDSRAMGDSLWLRHSDKPSWRKQDFSGVQKMGLIPARREEERRPIQWADVRNSFGAEGQREDHTKWITDSISEQKGVTLHRIEDGFHWYPRDSDISYRMWESTTRCLKEWLKWSFQKQRLDRHGRGSGVS